MLLYLSTLMPMRNLISLRLNIFVIILVFILLIALKVHSTNSSWSGYGTPPIDSDNFWYIDDNETISTKTEFSNGNLIINSSGKLIINSTGELTLRNVNIGFNTTGNGTPTIQVRSDGKLNMINLTTRIILSPDTELKYEIIFDKGSRVNITNSEFVLFNELKKPQIEIFSSQLFINNCIFGNGFAGLFFENVSGISIINSTFLTDDYGIIINNSENITFINCNFNNKIALFFANNSGNQKPLILLNCTFTKINEDGYSPIYFILNESKTMLVNPRNCMINVSEKLELTGNSRLDISWYLHLRTIDKNNKSIGNVDVSIFDNFDIEVFQDKTNDTGDLSCILLLTKEIKPNNIIDHNPFKIKAVKGKEKYTGTEYIELTWPNSSKVQILELVKKDDDDQNNFEDTLFMFCFCGLTIATVFLLLMSLNVYLARKKLGLNKHHDVLLGDGKQLPLGSGKELITCSECGTQVTDDATFCPHCGEYFESEELVCPGCNARLIENANECPKCGRVFEKSNISIEKDRETEKGLIHEKGPKSIIDAKEVSNVSDGSGEDNGNKRDKLFCSECGAVVYVSDQNCPSCGLLFVDKIEHKVSKPKKDSKNDEKVLRTAQKLTAMEEKSGSEFNKKKGKENKDGPVLRENNKADLEFEKDTLDGSYMCSICGADISEKTKICPKCGTELE